MRNEKRGTRNEEQGTRNIEFILQGVNVAEAESLPAVKNTGFSDDFRKVNSREFYLKIPGTGSFYVCNGESVEYSIEPGADREWVDLHLNGQVFAALLHQRKIINFHASSFIYKNRGIMILGETGAGKSSLTASFILNGAHFLSDDMTPVIFRESKPFIRPLNRSIKIDENTIWQLNIDRRRLREAEKGTGKFYLKVEPEAEVKEFPIHIILKIETGVVTTPEFHSPEPAERFSLLRSEICSWEILAGMPETEADYLLQLVKIIHEVPIIRVVRPFEIPIREMHEAIRDYLEQDG
jgi:hypothetical protein